MKSFLLHLFWICGRLTLLEAARWLLSRLAMAHVDAVANWHGGLHSSLASPVREQLLAELLERLRTGLHREDDTGG